MPKKRIIPLICLLVVAAAVIAALALLNRPQAEDPQVTGKVQTVTPTYMKYTLESASDYYYMWGRCFFRIEGLTDGKWQELPRQTDRIVTTMEAYELSPERRSCVMTEGWENIYGILPAGEYRFVQLMQTYHTKTNNYQNYDEMYEVYIPFEIQ